MTRQQLCTATIVLIVATATVSLTAAPRELRAAESAIPEVHPEDREIAPALAFVAASGLVGAFALGAAQGYMECKNSQKAGTPEPIRTLDMSELDHVLD
jgi:hypothetical protein